MINTIETLLPGLHLSCMISEKKTLIIFQHFYFCYFDIKYIKISNRQGQMIILQVNIFT